MNKSRTAQFLLRDRTRSYAATIAARMYGRIPAILWLACIGAAMLLASPAQAQTFGCTPAMANSIVCENSKAGTPSNVWQINGSGDPSIQGFATDISYDRGDQAEFKIKTDATAYRL